MSNSSYNQRTVDPIGKTFDFFGLDLIVDGIEVHNDTFADHQKVYIDSHISNFYSWKTFCKRNNPFGIKRVIFNGPATIVFWMDGTKTIVKCAKEEVYNQRTAIMWAIMKKQYGNNSLVNKHLDRLIEDAENASDVNRK